jgi:HSP20 family protein
MNPYFKDFRSFDWPLSLAGGLLRSLSQQSDGQRHLRAHVKTEDDKYTVKAEVPGLTQDQISMSFADSVLSIKAKWHDEVCNCGCRRDGEYIYAYRFQDVDNATIEASLANGILTVILPKAKDKLPTQITIKSGV